MVEREDTVVILSQTYTQRSWLHFHSFVMVCNSKILPDIMSCITLLLALLQEFA